MGYGKNKGMFCDLPEEERKVWQIQLILEPVGNGVQVVGDGVWEKREGIFLRNLRSNRRPKNQEEGV